MDVNIYLHVMQQPSQAEFLFGISPSVVSAFATILSVLVALFGKLLWDKLYRPRLCVTITNKRPYSIVVKQWFGKIQKDLSSSKSETLSNVPYTPNDAIWNYNANTTIVINDSIDDFSTNSSFSDCYLAKNTLDNESSRQYWSDDCKALYLRIGVKNYGRKLPAKSVEVFVYRIIQIDRDGKDGEPVDIAMNLRWSNVGDMRYPQILAKSERYCDIGFITVPEYRSYDPRYSSAKFSAKDKYPAFCVNVTHPLPNGEHILWPGRYKLEVMVSAVGAEPVTGIVIIEFSDWSNIESEIIKECIFENSVAQECDIWTYKLSRFFKGYFQAFQP
jgi:hypothetical protein